MSQKLSDLLLQRRALRGLAASSRMQVSTAISAPLASGLRYACVVVVGALPMGTLPALPARSCPTPTAVDMHNRCTDRYAKCAVR